MKKKPDPNPHRLMPSSLDAEMGMLSSFLLAPHLIEEYGWLTPEHYYQPACAELFRNLREMREKMLGIDLITVTQWLSDRGLLEPMGGAGWLTDIFAFVPTASNASYYAAILSEKFSRRSIISAASELIDKAHDDITDPDQLVEDCESTLMALGRDKAMIAAMVPLINAGMAAVDQIEAAYKSRGKTVGLPTGINDFDRMTGGLKGGQVIIVAARPGQGKTSFALQSAQAMCEREPGAIFSMEMNSTELATRVICANAPINLQRVRDGYMAEKDMKNIGTALYALEQKKIYIDETPALSIFDFRSRARRAVVRYGIKWIIIDYLQLMRSTSKRAQESRAIEVAEISMAIKAAAKELKIPIIALAQLNRDAEQRSGPPKLSDLRESGQIEQDADIICFLHRPKKDSEDPEERMMVDLVVAKHRDGPVNTVKLKFHAEFAKFENVTPKFASNNPDERQK